MMRHDHYERQQQLNRALDHLDPHAYDTWLRVGLALKAEGEYDLFIAWSSRASNYKRSKVDAQWRTFKPRIENGLAYLSKMAGLSGEQPAPPRPQPKPKPKPQPPAVLPRERDVRQWHTLATTGSSDYLNRKGVATVASPCLRYAHDHITLLLLKFGHDGSVDEVATQRIYDNGNKRLSKRHESEVDSYLTGAFILVGATVEQLLAARRVWIAEGYASAAAVAMATGEPVVAAIAAFNLQHVAKGLRRHLDHEVEVVIAADNDKWDKKSGELKAEGVPNVGLEAAHEAALRYRCKVATPQKLEPRDTDFADVLLRYGVETVKKQLTKPQQPEPALAWPRDTAQRLAEFERDKWRRRCYAIDKKAQLEPAQFDHVVETNERYLSQQTIDKAVSMAGGRAVFVVESPVGSGKTTSLLARYANESSLLTLSPLQALCAQLSADSNSLNYLQPAGHERDKYDPTHLIGDAPAGYEPRPAEFWRDYHHHDNKRLVCTPHSLSKLAQSKHGQHSNGLIYRHKHVIVDESDSCLNVLSDNSVENEQSIYEALRGAMFGALSQGGSVWLSSAHHHDSELALVEGVVDEYEQVHGERLPIALIKNTYKPNSGRSYEVIKPRGDTKNPRRALRAGLLERVSERLTEGACVALASDSDVFAREAYKQLSEQFERVLLVDAQNKGGHEQQRFIATRDPSQWQCVIYSPVLTSGFSVAAGHGFEVFGYSSARSVSPKGFEQLLGRFRDVDHYTLALEQYREGKTFDVAEIKRELAESDTLDSDLLKQTIDGRLTWRDEGFVDLHARNISHDRWLRSNWRTHLLALLEATGRQSVDAVEVEVSEAATARYNHTREAVELAEAEAIATAQRLEPAEVERIEAKSAPTREQLLAVERYKYESFYGVEATPERLLEDKRGRERAIVQRLVLARASDEMLRYLTEHDAKRAQFSDGVATARASVKRKRYAVKRLLYRAVLTAANVDVSSLQAFTDYHASAKSVATFTDTLRKHHTAFRHEATLPKRSQLKQHATRVLGRQLRELGFTTESEQRRNNEGEQVRHYMAMLNLDAYPHLAERIAEREAVLNRQLEQWQGKQQPIDHRQQLSNLPTYEQPYCHSTSQLYIDSRVGVCDSRLRVRDGTNGTFQNTFFNSKKSPAVTPPQPTKPLPFDVSVAFSRALNRGQLDHLKAGHRAKLRNWLNQGNTTMLLKAYEAAPEPMRERIRRA